MTRSRYLWHDRTSDRAVFDLCPQWLAASRYQLRDSGLSTYKNRSKRDIVLPPFPSRVSLASVLPLNRRPSGELHQTSEPLGVSSVSMDFRFKTIPTSR
jgi:hypothetical protein